MNLSKFIQQNENARKIFGKKEIKIILKQLNGITLSQSEKNRLSRDIRPKFKFVKEAANFKNEFKLKKNSITKKISEQVVEKILEDEQRKNVKAILLFGSHANGIVTYRSDIDFCVVFRKDISSEEAFNFRIRIGKDFSDKVDIQVFNSLPQKIKRDIARNHKLLYHAKDFDNIGFSIRYLKDNDYFIRMKSIMGGSA